MDEFTIYHIPREENARANALAQQVSRCNIQKRNFHERKPTLYEAEGYVLEEPVQLASETSLTGPAGLIAQIAGLTDLSGEVSTSAMDCSKLAKDEVDVWIKPLIDYLQNPKCSVDRKI